MSLITQQIKALTGGVSQAPASRRLAEQVTALVNGWPEKARGLGKRPTSDFVAQLASDESGYTSAFEHLINRNEDERYRVVIIDDDLVVFDTTGVEQTVTFPHGKGYLNAPIPNTTFRAVTVGDKTYIVNTSQATAKSVSPLDVSPERTNEALLWFREGDFSTQYSAVFSYNGTEWDPTISSPDGTDVEDRAGIDPTALAGDMVFQMTDTGEQDMETDGWTVVQYDSVIHVYRNDGADFGLKTIEGVEGTGQERIEPPNRKWANWKNLKDRLLPSATKNAFVGIYDAVSRLEDLPPRGPDSFRVQVVGSPDNEYDNAWFVYLNGEWQECVAPGEVVALNSATLPHELIRSTLIYDDMESVREPATTVSADDTGGSAQSDTGFTDAQNDGGSAVNSGAPLTTVGETQGNSEVNFYCQLDNADGVETEYNVNLVVDCTTLAGGQFASIIVYYNDGAGSTSWTYGDDVDLNVTDGVWSGTLSFTATLDADYDIKIYMRTQQGWVDGFGASIYATSVDYVALATNTDIEIDLEAGTVYPVGTVVTATVNGNDNDYTVAGGDETAEEVATGLELLIEDDTNISSSVSGAVITVSHTTTTPTITVTSTYDDTKTVILVRDMGWTEDELVGLLVENLTDGSQGTITSNGSRSITASAGISGGNDNTFQFGDEIRVITNSSTFVFQQVNWKRRACGTIKTNPFPSFIGEKISEVFYHAGRLGLAWKEQLVLSRAGDVNNLFRKSVLQILDDDPIDIKYAGRGSSIIHSATEVQQRLVLWSEIGQMLLTSGENPLTPRTAQLVPLTHYENTGKVRPLPYGSRTMFCLGDGGATQVFSYKWDEQERPQADSLCPHVPTYLQGNPISWAISKQHDAVFVLTDDDQSLLYAGKITENRGDVDAAWCQWQFGANDTILSVDVLDDTLGLVVSRDEGVFLETITIAEGFQNSEYIDRKMDQDDVTPSYETPYTFNETFTYDDGTDATTIGWTTGAGYNRAKVYGNTLHPLLAHTARWDAAQPLIDGSIYEMYGDLIQDTSGSEIGIVFMLNNTGAPGERGQFYMKYVNATTVDFKFYRFDGGYQDTQDIALAQPVAYGEGRRIGVTIDLVAYTITPWIEDLGGGNRVTYSAVTWTAASWFTDGNHESFGWFFNGVGTAGDSQRIDELDVTESGSGIAATYITLPFDIPAADGNLVVLMSDGTLYTATDYTKSGDNIIILPAAAGDVSAENFVLGWTMDFDATLSEIFNRDFRTGLPLIGGKLQLLTALLEYANTIDFDFTAARTTPSRSFTYSVSNATATTGDKQVPVGTQSSNAVLSLSSSTIYQLWLQALTWEGDWTERARRF